ncbi:MAG: ComEC/Rec2 family competence protein, partial [Actinomyces dentalis]
MPRSAPVDAPASDRRPERVDAPPAPEALDLRLAPVALAAWAAAGWGCAAGVRACLGAGAVALAAAGIALVPALRHRPARHRHDPRPGAQVPGGARGSVAASALAVALACASVLGVTAALLHVRERDPLTIAAAASRRATLVATVTTAPRPVVTAHRTAVLVELGVRSVDGAPSRQRAVVLGDSRWLDLPLGATVRVHGPLRAAQPGSAEAARLGAGASVRVLADPSGSLARVGRLREGLARAAGAEPADVDGAEQAAGAEPDGDDGVPAPAGPSAPRWPPGARALGPGVALGDDHALPRTVREEMRAVSMTHLTAVSGQHVALVLGLVLTGLGAVPRRVRAGAGLVVLTGLVVLVRPGGSVLRAGVMGAVMLAGVASGRRSVSVPALAGAVLILVLIDPWQSRDYGFALSAAATAGILVGERPVRAALSRRLPRWLAASLALPLVAQAACAPVLILLQPQVGLWSVPANVIAAPPVPLATICGLAAALVEPLWPGAAAWAALPAVASCAWLAAVAHVFAALPGARIPWPGGRAGAVGLAVLEAAAALLVSRRARRR